MICAKTLCKNSYSRVPFAINPIFGKFSIRDRICLPNPGTNCPRFSSSPSPPRCTPPSPPQSTPHIPVLLNEVLSFFEGRDIQVYVDGTLGAGGHATAIVGRTKPRVMVGFDMDPTAHALASDRLSKLEETRIVPVSYDAHNTISDSAGHVTISDSEECSKRDGVVRSGATTAFLVKSNFSAMENVLKQLTMHDSTPLFGNVDALLLDLGVSSMQLDTDDRGFSFLRDGPLDMRMDPSAALSAEEVVNTWPESEIGFLLKELGEERYWKSVARKIAAAREEAPIRTTRQLASIIGRPGGISSTKKKGDSKHPATRTFQALRIAVNNELHSIASVMPVAIESLSPGGRLAVITFHSLEDRIVKWAFRRAAGMADDSSMSGNEGSMSMMGGNGGGVGSGGGMNKARRKMMVGSIDGSAVMERGDVLVKILTKKPVVPTDEETDMNARSRSAKLRIVEKL